MGRLILLSWHIGSVADLTFGAFKEVRRLRLLLVESVEDARRELGEHLRIPIEGKEFLLIPEQRDPALLRRILARLKTEDVGLMASGGTPAFIDPGAWLVAEVRAAGAKVVARPGASCLTQMLALSGIEWRSGEVAPALTFAFYRGLQRREGRSFRAVVRRRENIFVFLAKDCLHECLGLLREEVGDRPVTVFFDQTKRPREKFPLADEVRTMTCDAWLEAFPAIPWKKVSDVALMIGA